MAGKHLGTMTCLVPVCGKVADVKEGEKGAPYIHCEHCNTMVRTMTRGVKDWMRAQAKGAPTPPAPEKKPDDKKPEPDKKAEPKRASALRVLGIG